MTLTQWAYVRYDSAPSLTAAMTQVWRLRGLSVVAVMDRNHGYGCMHGEREWCAGGCHKSRRIQNETIGQQICYSGRQWGVSRLLPARAVQELHNR